MDALDLGRVRSGIDVCDVGGEKIGTVAHVYLQAVAPVGEGGTLAARPGEEIVEVKTGPLDLGKHLYVPRGAIDTLNDAGDCLALNVSKDHFDPAWESRPDYLSESHRLALGVGPGPHEEGTATPGRQMAVVAVYDDVEQAERAIDELRRFDFAEDQIGLAVCEGAAPAGVSAEARRAGRPVTVGGAVAGGLLGALAAGVIPGLGPVLAGGLLLGLVEGAAAGGLLGLLIGLGLPEPRARGSVQAFELGRTVVVVRAEGERLEEARDRLQAYGPYQLDLTEQPTPPTCD
jgi:hypothetical protein